MTRTGTLQQHAAEMVDMVPHIDTLTRYAERANTILELGVRTGVSTWALLDGLHEDGRLVSVDIVDVRGHMPNRILADRRWTFLIGDDRTLALPIDTADLVFIDTSHEYHHTVFELDLAARLRAEWILLHDYELDDVADAVAGFLRRGTYRLALIEPSQWGLAGLQRCR